MANEIKKEEMLTEEQLEGVAGGTWTQTANDRKFFTALKVSAKSVGDCWKKYGIDFASKAGANDYKTGDTNNSQVKAYGIVLQKLGYEGYTFSPDDAENTKAFVKEKFGIAL